MRQLYPIRRPLPDQSRRGTVLVVTAIGAAAMVGMLLLIVETGMISPEDVHLFRYVETADEAWETLREVYGLGQPDADTACGW